MSAGLRSTFVTVARIARDERVQVVERLARHLVDRYGAPSEGVAQAAAEAEVGFAEELADQPAGTLIAVERVFGPDGVVERFRTIERSSERPHARIWALEPDDGDG